MLTGETAITVSYLHEWLQTIVNFARITLLLKKHGLITLVEQMTQIKATELSLPNMDEIGEIDMDLTNRRKL